MAREPAEDLIYSPAKRRGVGALIMFAGPSGSGKTKSALRLATGLANGGPIFGCDTEHGRMLYYADEFEFLHGELKEPFNPSRFEAAAVIAQKAKAAVWICDSFSHEHIGPGGLLDMAETELQRMAGDDYAKRDRMKMASWIKPKGEHNRMVQRLWQLNCHIILCCHAQKKIEMVKDKDGKIKPVDIGYQPICGDDIPYAMTASFMFHPSRPGVPIWVKHFDKLEKVFDTNRVIDEDTGRRLGAWARGEDRKPAPSAPSAPAASVESSPATAGDFPGDLPLEVWRPVEPDEVFEPGRSFRMNTATGQNEVLEVPIRGKPAGKLDPETGKPGKNEETTEALIAKFTAVRNRTEHYAIVDDKTDRSRLAWLKRNKPELYARVEVALKASWARTETREKEQV